MPHGLSKHDRPDRVHSEHKLYAVGLASSSQAGHAIYLYVGIWAGMFLLCSKEAVALNPEALCR